MTNDYQGKTCAVLGLARAGAPAARFLAEQGAHVIGYDNAAPEALGEEAGALAELGVELRTGDHGYAGIENCSLVVLSPGWKIHHEPLRSVIAQCEARGAEVIGELELASRHCPAPIIAVTGTKGKSTTVKLIAEMLQACGINAIRAGNTGIPLIAELPQLTPESWAIVEVSSFQLERAPTFKPRVAVLLSLLSDHLDYHPSFAQYWGSKLKLFANQGEGDTSIFNIDDPRVSDLLAGRSAQWDSDALTFTTGKQRTLASSAGEQSKASVAAVTASRDGQLGWQIDGNFIAAIEVAAVPLRGRHNQSNLAAALAALWAVLGDDAIAQCEKIGEAIRNFESLPHRLEIVSAWGGRTWVNDSQATIPDATVKALASFAAPLTLIAGGRAKLDEAAAYERLGNAILAHATYLITIGEDAESIASAAIAVGFEKGAITSAGTLERAVAEAARLTPEGGTILLSPACASFDQFKNYEARGEAFKNAILALQKGS